MKTQEVPLPASAAPIALLPSDTVHTRLLRVLLVIWRAMTISRKVAVGSAIVGFFIVVGLIGPFFMTTNPNATSPLFIAPPSAAHWLGTTVVGEDIFSQLILGAGLSLINFGIDEIADPRLRRERPLKAGKYKKAVA